MPVIFSPSSNCPKSLALLQRELQAQRDTFEALVADTSQQADAFKQRLTQRDATINSMLEDRVAMANSLLRVEQSVVTLERLLVEKVDRLAAGQTEAVEKITMLEVHRDTDAVALRCPARLTLPSPPTR